MNNPERAPELLNHPELALTPEEIAAAQVESADQYNTYIDSLQRIESVPAEQPETPLLHELPEPEEINKEEVSAARKVIDELFLKSSPANENSSAEVGKSQVVAGESVANGNARTVTLEEARQRKAELTARTKNGMAARKQVHKVGDEAKRELEGIGVDIKVPTRADKQDAWAAQKLTGEAQQVTHAHGAKEQDITQNSREAEVVNILAGEGIIEALASPERTNKQLREYVTELANDDPKAFQALSRAVSYFRQSGKVNRLTAKDVGEHSVKKVA